MTPPSVEILKSSQPQPFLLSLLHFYADCLYILHWAAASHSIVAWTLAHDCVLITANFCECRHWFWNVVNSYAALPQPAITPATRTLALPVWSSDFAVAYAVSENEFFSDSFQSLIYLVLSVVYTRVQLRVVAPRFAVAGFALVHKFAFVDCHAFPVVKLLQASNAAFNGRYIFVVGLV